MVFNISRIMAKARYTSKPPVSTPASLKLPEDLKAFYRTYGEVMFFPDGDYSFVVHGEDRLQRSDMYVLGEDVGEELSANWYVIATCDDQTISICLSDGNQFGWCYDSYWDIYPAADSITLIATSFTDLLEMIVADGGRSLFWIAGRH